MSCNIAARSAEFNDVGGNGCFVMAGLAAFAKASAAE
jgi:hypothetical protein